MPSLHYINTPDPVKSDKVRLSQERIEDTRRFDETQVYSW